MMMRTTLFVVGLMLTSTTAIAGQNWQTFTFSTTPANQAKVLAALDKLMTANGTGDQGSAALMANVAGGDNSNTFISSFDTRAAREAWSQSLNPSPAWTEFTKTTDGLIERGSTSRMDIVKSWGEQNPKDVFWEIYAFTVTDADDFSEAIDNLLASGTGKKFPGQVHLSAVAAAGMSQSTHLISVGFESVAVAEAWDDTLSASKDWASYLKASGEVSTSGGAYMIRTIKAWDGSAK
jgi:hypothetical protein